MESDRERCHRPSAFDKMEGLVREMQDPENGVPVRSQKLFLTSIPSAFMGYDLIEWLMERLGVEESEALNLAHQLCQYGYLFPVSDSKNLVVKDDSSLYRFQSPYYWPWQNRPPDNVEYAIYLAKRTLRNKQRHGLEEYELEALGNLRKNLANKWDFITMQAEEQVKLAKVLKKGDKIVSDSQERAYWRVHRPPPGINSSLEQCPVPTRCRNGNRTRKRTIIDCKREVELLQKSLSRTRVKVSQALEGMVHHVETYSEYDPLISGTQPSNPWVSEDLTFWQINSPLVDAPTEKRVKRWGLSMEELVSDPTGLQEFTNYLRKEYSHENIRFWTAVNDLRRSAHSQIQRKVSEIFDEFLAPGAPCEINIDGKTMEKVHQEMKTPSRFTFDAAQDHVYTLLLKKDCYPRFIRSDLYKNLLATGIQPSAKKRFFGFGPTKKKTSTSSAPNPGLLQQQSSQGGGGAGNIAGMAGGCALAKRRGSDRSLSGSAHELAVSGVGGVGGGRGGGVGVGGDSRVPHSHSQSNLSDIPYRGDMPSCHGQPAMNTIRTVARMTVVGPVISVKKPSIALAAAASTSEDVCPWESTSAQPPPPPASSTTTITTTPAPIPQHQSASTTSRSRKNSIHQTAPTLLDSGSSSSEISVVTEVADRLRRTCNVLMQQHTVDGGGKLHGADLTVTCATTTPRRASVCVVPVSGSGSGDNTTGLASLTASTSRRTIGASVEDCCTGESAEHGLVVANTLFTPTISVSSAVDDLPSSPPPPPPPPLPPPPPPPLVENIIDNHATGCCDATTTTTASAASAVSGSTVVVVTRLQLAPLAEPDSESPISEFPPSPDVLSLAQSQPPPFGDVAADVEKVGEGGGELEERQQGGGGTEEGKDDDEARSNDVCPWEDEETCKVDAPFRKTYATLGFL